MASPAPQSEADMEPRSPQAKELIEAMRPEMSNEEMKNSLMSAIDRKVQAKCKMFVVLVVNPENSWLGNNN